MDHQSSLESSLAGLKLEDPVLDFYSNGCKSFHIKEFTVALDHFSNALKADPKNARSYNGAALCLLELGRIEEALAILNNVLALDPTLACVHNNKVQRELEGNLPLRLHIRDCIGD
jgi:tetratricopeptide (TPR) repeat protein